MVDQNVYTKKEVVNGSGAKLLGFISKKRNKVIKTAEVLPEATGRMSNKF